MAEQVKQFNVAQDFPDGKVNSENLSAEVAAVITRTLKNLSFAGGTPLEGGIHEGGTLSMTFADTLTSADETALHGDTSNPCGGLIADHDNSATPEPEQPVKFNAPPFVAPVLRPSGTPLWAFSHDYTKRTTWFSEAEYVEESQIGTGDGATKNFLLGDSNIIDVTHGHISEEDTLDPEIYGHEGISSFAPIIKVNDVVKTEAPYDGTGGDYTLDYASGTVSFAVAPPSGHTIKASYFKEDGGQMILPVPYGYKYTLKRLEMQFSKDLTLMTTTFAEVWAGPPGGKFYVPGSRGTFKNLKDFLNWSEGSFPVIPQFGGSGDRGLQDDVIILSIPYEDPLELKGSDGAEWRCRLEGDIPHQGSYATTTIYGVTEEE
jgi:hypothetical protein